VVPVERIIDPDDERLAEYRNVPDGDLLAGRGSFVAEGRLVVRRLLTASRFAARSVMVTEAACHSLQDVLAAAPLPVYLVPPALPMRITGFNIHRGCLALGERGAALDWRTIVPAARRLVLVERVANADNIGSIFRNAVAFGVDGVLLDEASTDPLYRKAIRTSMGASLSLPFARFDPTRDLSELRCQGISVIGLTPGATETVRQVARRTSGQRVALMLGHEGEGLSSPALAACDHLARIPMANGVDSINVAAAAAVALYELDASV
jgi:tRNA G18 (ribose-2'-O)-methylase SpoU